MATLVITRGYFIGPFVSDPLQEAYARVPGAGPKMTQWVGQAARDHGQLKIPRDLGKIHTIILTNYNFTIFHYGF